MIYRYLFICLLSVASISQAGLKGEFDNLFDNMMVNSTGGGGFEGQQRNYYSPGGLVVRAPIVKANVIQLTLPSFELGCGGFDFQGGSFSFITKDEFVAFARAILQNATGYAFKLALEGMCPACDQIMQNLKNSVNKINGYMKDSCDTTAQIFEKRGWADTLREKNGKLKQKHTREGTTDDWFDQWSNWNSSADLLGDSSAKDQKILLNNLTWDVMEKSDVKSWTATVFAAPGSPMVFAEETELRRLIMTFVGTVVVHPLPAGTPTNGSAGIIPTFYHPLLSFNDFIGDGKTVQKVRLYKCPTVPVGTPDNCMLNANPALASEEVDYAGFYKQVKDILIGVGGNTGILGKIIAKYAVFTDKEKEFMNTVPRSVYTTLKALARNRSVARTQAEIISLDIAVEIAAQSLDDILTEFTKASGAMAQEDKVKMYASITAAREQMKWERANMYKKTEQFRIALQTEKLLREHMKKESGSSVGP